jgi:hypothetical protein
MKVWGQVNVSDLYDRANAEEGAAAELRVFRELEIEEEAAFSSFARDQDGDEGLGNRLRHACR